MSELKKTSLEDYRFQGLEEKLKTKFNIVYFLHGQKNFCVTITASRSCRTLFSDDGKPTIAVLDDIVCFLIFVTTIFPLPDRPTISIRFHYPEIIVPLKGTWILRISMRFCSNHQDHIHPFLNLFGDHLHIDLELGVHQLKMGICPMS